MEPSRRKEGRPGAGRYALRLHTATPLMNTGLLWRLVGMVGVAPTALTIDISIDGDNQLTTRYPLRFFSGLPAAGRIGARGGRTNTLLPREAAVGVHALIVYLHPG